MSKILDPHDYTENVFINCPFDRDYEPLFYAMIFAVRDLDLNPISARHVSDGGQPRITKILELNPLMVKTQSGATIYRRYKRFQVDLPTYCERLNWDVDNLAFADYLWAIHNWIKSNPIQRT